MRSLTTLVVSAAVASPALAQLSSSGPLAQDDNAVAIHHLATPTKEIRPCVIDTNGQRALYQLNTWPGGVVPYQFDGAVEQVNRDNTRAAMDELEEVARLTFVERRDERDYIEFRNSDGNNSALGQIGGEQIINMFNWEVRTIIQHEIMHALGFYHEQQRPDRDQYIQVLFQNIEFEFRNQYEIAAGAFIFGDYNFESIMHYGPCGFSVCPGGCAFDNLDCATMTVNPAFPEFADSLGNRDTLSDGDILALQELYGAPTIDNDDCLSSEPISLNQFVSRSNGVALSFGEASCAASGKDAWYAFTPDVDERFLVTTCGSDFDTVLSVYSNCNDPGAEVACNNDNFQRCGAGFSSALIFEGQAGTEYLIRVGGVNDDAGTYNLAIAVAPPSNDDCSGSDPITGDGVFAFDNEFATTDGVASDACSIASPQIERDVWYTWTANATGNVQLSMCGQADFDTNVIVYSGLNCPVGQETIVCDDDGCGGLQSELFWAANSGDSFLIRIGSYAGVAGGEGTFTITTGPALDNDECASQLPVSGDGVFAFDVAVATTDGAPLPQECQFFENIDDAQIEKDIWFAWTAAFDGDTTFSTCNQSVVDTKMAIYRGFECGGSQLMACSEDAPDCALQSEITLTNILAGEEYLIRLGVSPTASANVGRGSLSITTELATGACCTDDGCAVVSERDCAAMGGAYLGDGRECEYTPAGNFQTVDGGVENAPLGPNPADPPVVETFTLENPPAQVGAIEVSVDVMHPFIEDVEITLTHDASGTTVVLIDDACEGFQTLDRINARFSMQAPTLSCLGGGGGGETNVRPDGDLGDFVGLDGDSSWTLTIRDDFLDTAGTVASVGLHVDAVADTSCCICEVDGNAATINIADLLFFLNSWFTFNDAADLNADGAVNIVDLLEFLACYLPASNNGGDC